MAESYRDLIVWQRAVQMSVRLYKFTSAFPREELYGLTSQLRRAGVSVASNIAEGWGRRSEGEFQQFLGMARGSNLEVQTQLYISAELGYGQLEKLQLVEGYSDEVARMLVSLMNHKQSKAAED